MRVHRLTPVAQTPEGAARTGRIRIVVLNGHRNQEDLGPLEARLTGRGVRAL